MSDEDAPPEQPAQPQPFDPGGLQGAERRRLVKAVARYLFTEIRKDARRETSRKLAD